MKHRVAVIPDQKLDDDQLVAFTELLRPSVRSRADEPAERYKRKEVMELSNLDGVRGLVDYELDFGAWTRPIRRSRSGPSCTALWHLLGGQPLFSDLAGAYASLPDDLRGQVDGVTAVYSAGAAPEGT